MVAGPPWVVIAAPAARAKLSFIADIISAVSADGKSVGVPPPKYTVSETLSENRGARCFISFINAPTYGSNRFSRPA